MAIELKKRDVAIVGLGAAGGVAALPLAGAGLSDVQMFVVSRDRSVE